MIALIDYGAGNLASVRKALEAVRVVHYTPDGPKSIDRATGLVVPGVGHFASTATLDGRWREAILRRVEAGVPLLGICLGMQWLFEGSTEATGVDGLGIIRRMCTRLDVARPLKVPHVGWNDLTHRRSSAILAGVRPGAHVYFTHSYAAPVTADCVGAATHAHTFAAAVERGNVFGVQFHPEKSSDAGLQVLKNFLEIAGAAGPGVR